MTHTRRANCHLRTNDPNKQRVHQNTNGNNPISGPMQSVNFHSNYSSHLLQNKYDTHVYKTKIAYSNKPTRHKCPAAIADTPKYILLGL